MALNDKAMLVRLSISQWYARVTDRKVTDEVAARYQLEERDDRYVKALVPPAAMRSLNSAIRELRAFHNANTLPWQDGSVRVLSTGNYFRYQQGMTERRQLFEHEVEHFVTNYPKWLEHARRTKKELFDESQYPTQAGLRQLFSVETVVLPFPNVDDFRVDVGKDEMQVLQQAAHQAVVDSMQQATKELLARLYDRVGLLHSALSDPEKIFRDGTFTSVLETAEVAESLNLAGDEQVTLAVAAIRQALQDVTPEILRLGTVRRGQVAERLAEIITALKG